MYNSREETRNNYNIEYLLSSVKEGIYNQKDREGYITNHIILKTEISSCLHEILLKWT